MKENLHTYNECTNALKDMKNNKNPGSDGLTTEFFLIFWNNIEIAIEHRLTRKLIKKLKPCKNYDDLDSTFGLWSGARLL